MENLTTDNLHTTLSNLLSKFNTLLDCHARFSGGYGGQEVQHFIEYIKSYKRIKCITDEQALKELGYLLTEHAHTWWVRRKCYFGTWSEALTALQNQYAKQRPTLLIYKDIFEHRFEDYSTEEDFIDDKYELLAELPDPKQSEKNKLDMIFALLPIVLQAKLPYANITTVMELKEQILKLKRKQNVITETKDINNSSINNNSTKEQLTNGQGNGNGNGMTVIAADQCEAMDIPTIICVNDKDPLIKVRRTEDLMPHIKSEESGETNLDQQEEFISTGIILRNQQQQPNENSNFQIDVDIMNQINNIIDESEMNCDTVNVSSIMSAKENPTNTIRFLLNGETTIQPEVSNKPHPAVRAEENSNARKFKLRCTYCRKYNHIAQDCLKRARHMQLFPEKFILKTKMPSEDPLNNDKEETATNNNNNNSNNNSISNKDTENSVTTSEPASTTTSPPSVSNTSTLITTECIASIVQQAIAASVAPTNSHSHCVSLPPAVSSSFSHTTTMSSTSTTPTTALTTKLIAPINGPCPSKQLAAKLRSINGPSPKCHQCGTVGFYKSICPNCSPIYNSSQYK